MAHLQMNNQQYEWFPKSRMNTSFWNVLFSKATCCDISSKKRWGKLRKVSNKTYESWTKLIHNSRQVYYTFMESSISAKKSAKVLLKTCDAFEYELRFLLIQSIGMGYTQTKNRKSYVFFMLLFGTFVDVVKFFCGFQCKRFKDINLRQLLQRGE